MEESIPNMYITTLESVYGCVSIEGLKSCISPQSRFIAFRPPLLGEDYLGSGSKTSGESSHVCRATGNWSVPRLIVGRKRVKRVILTPRQTQPDYIYNGDVYRFWSGGHLHTHVSMHNIPRPKHMMVFDITEDEIDA